MIYRTSRVLYFRSLHHDSSSLVLSTLRISTFHTAWEIRQSYRYSCPTIFLPFTVYVRKTSFGCNIKTLTACFAVAANDHGSTVSNENSPPVFRSSSFTGYHLISFREPFKPTAFLLPSTPRSFFVLKPVPQNHFLPRGHLSHV